MSKFSEEIKKVIEESEMTLLSLSDASGLSVDHISKMRRGVRLPQDTEKVQKLIIALQRSEEESRKLMTLYRIERMGDEEWKCMKGIQQLLEYGNKLPECVFDDGENDKHIAETDSSFSWLRASSVCVRDVITVIGEGNIKILHNRSEVFSFLQNSLCKSDHATDLFWKELSALL